MTDSKWQGSDDVGDVNDNVDLNADNDHDDGNVDTVYFDADNDYDISDLLATIKYPGHSRPTTNYYEIAKFGLPDLRPAIADFLHREATHGRDHVHTIGGARRAGPTTPLPFDKLQVWFKLRLQDTDFHDISIIRPAQTLNCAPPSDPRTSGRYDMATINNEARCVWPTDGLHGHTIGQIRLLMRPVGKSGTNWSWKDRFLVYVHRFDIVPQSSGTNDREPSTQLHLLKRAKHSNGTQFLAQQVLG
ncbi:hypothetical protein DFJ58DRAFT_848930 [Suillus subalutaceus]|uniref:uncharacterized protein n=1 Tax=Suillus subalutaceus TaxID=48586 RepID=UPI001B85D055|nr:uncharacterized protein DFJ58DRAFT_848930 [Suillus subalutaceus]KAG1828759.1 hypothetical protein DFJ58DRAFT_848930 [Suillus subalutaceus]